MTTLGVGACRSCGCTDQRACDGGCIWVENDLCSRCYRAGVPPLYIAGDPLGLEDELVEDGWVPPSCLRAAGCVCPDVECESCGPCALEIDEHDAEFGDDDD